MTRLIWSRSICNIVWSSALVGALGGAVGLAVGCGDKGATPTKNMDARVTRAPKHPPYPALPSPVPLDPALAASAHQVLRDSLGSDDALDRAHALEALQNVEAKTISEADSAAIIGALNDPQAIMRFAAAMAAGQLRLAAAHDGLMKIAFDRSPSVRVGVRFALHRIGDTHLSHDLEQLSQDPLPSARANTALVLGLLGEQSGLGILRPMRTDSQATVRQQAWEAMWRLGDTQGLDDLVGLSVSQYPDDQMIGLIALAEPRDRRVRGQVRGALVSDYVEVTLVAARAVGMLGSDEGYVLAVNGVKSGDARQRQLGALALGAIGRSDAQDVLRPLLTDKDAGVRIAAAEAILQLRTPEQTARELNQKSGAAERN